MAAPQLFGVIPTGCPVITNPTSTPSPTSFIFALPSWTFSHIVVFLLPGITLPPDTAAAVYFAIATSASTSTNLNFKFLGGIGLGKESAVFRVKNDSTNNSTASMSQKVTGGEADMDAPKGSPVETTPLNPAVALGVSIESSSSVAAQMATLSSDRNLNLGYHPASKTLGSGTLVTVPGLPNPPLDTLQLAQRIIGNAFNFLASFSGNVPVPGATGTAGVEVVPLKAFEDWWNKFERRVKNDPRFLERDSG